jgi:hypothetical protein
MHLDEYDIDDVKDLLTDRLEKQDVWNAIRKHITSIVFRIPAQNN